MFQMPGSIPCKGETVNTEHYPFVADITKNCLRCGTRERGGGWWHLDGKYPYCERCAFDRTSDFEIGCDANGSPVAETGVSD